MTTNRIVALGATTLAALLILLDLPFALSAASGPRPYIIVLHDDAKIADVRDGIAPGFERAEAGTERTRSPISTKFEYGDVINGFAADLTDEQLKDLEKDPRVKYIAPDGVLYPAGQVFSTGYSRIGLSTTTRYVNQGQGVDVGIIDTGVLYTHADLNANLAGGTNCSGAGSGYSDTWITAEGHGTSVAGIIAAEDNDEGAVGIAPKSRYWSIRVCDPSNGCLDSSLICGLNFAKSKAPALGGALKVVNISLSGTGASDNNCGLTNNDPLHTAMCNLRDAGVTIVAAGGNFWLNGIDGSQVRPANFNDAVIAVSSITDTDGMSGGIGPLASTSNEWDDVNSYFSNPGTTTMELAAPGMDIYTPNKLGYGYFMGTSASAPHVAGAAALYLAAHPTSTWTQVRDALVNLADPASTLFMPDLTNHPEPILNISGLVGSTTVTEYTTPGTYTWTKPAQYGFAKVECWGGGGGGGSTQGPTAAVWNQCTPSTCTPIANGQYMPGLGSGGGGGGYRTKSISLATLPATVTVTVGAGGAGGSPTSQGCTSGRAGVIGGNSSFGSYVVAGGGRGGAVGACKKYSGTLDYNNPATFPDLIAGAGGLGGTGDAVGGRGGSKSNGLSTNTCASGGGAGGSLPGFSTYGQFLGGTTTCASAWSINGTPVGNFGWGSDGFDFVANSGWGAWPQPEYPGGGGAGGNPMVEIDSNSNVTYWKYGGNGDIGPGQNGQAGASGACKITVETWN